MHGGRLEYERPCSDSLCLRTILCGVQLELRYQSSQSWRPGYPGSNLAEHVLAAITVNCLCIGDEFVFGLSPGMATGELSTFRTTPAIQMAAWRLHKLAMI